MKLHRSFLLVFMVSTALNDPAMAAPSAPKEPADIPSSRLYLVADAGFDLTSPRRANGTCYNTGSEGTCEGFGFPAAWAHLPGTLFALAEENVAAAKALANVLDDALSANFRNVDESGTDPMDRLLIAVNADFLIHGRMSRQEERRFARAVEQLLAYLEDHD